MGRILDAIRNIGKKQPKITEEMLVAIAPQANRTVVSRILTNLETELKNGAINDYLAIAHFLAQAAHETDGFKVLEEYASGQAYEGRSDLGNTQLGDGRRYKGRGIFMLTGRYNYASYGRLLNVPLEAQPELAADGPTSVRIAVAFWNSKNLTPVARADDVELITRRINGGLNGFEDRKTYLRRAKAAIPTNIRL